MLTRKERIPLSKLLTIGILPSVLKVLFYRLKGASIGKGVHIGIGSIIEGTSVVIGDGVSIGFGTMIRGREIIIGRYTEIGSTVYIDVPRIKVGEDVVIREQVFVGGNETPDSSFSIGDRSHIRQMVTINTSKPVTIGEESAIGGSTLIFTHSTWQSRLEGYPCTFAPVTIGNNVWISWDVFILPGVEIGNGVLVAAGSVVTKNLPEKCLATGNPAKVVIPSGRYPRRISQPERYKVVRLILEQAWTHLRFHEFEVEEDNAENSVLATIRRDGKEYRFLFTSDLGSESNIPLEKVDVWCSLEEYRPSDVKHIVANGGMILDIGRKQRFGRNALGEEMAAFFLRYGIKFKRMDD